MGGKTSYESKKKYEDKAYDRISVVFKKGDKERIREISDRQNKSLNAFIVEAVNEKIERAGELILGEKE